MAAQATCVVVAFHRPALLERLLRGLTDPRLEVVVVNIEEDAAVARLEGVRHCPVGTNVGWGAGVNRGVAHASTDVVVCMNDDVLLDAADVLRLTDRLRSGHADVVVPLVEDERGELELAEKIPYRLAERMVLKGDPVPDGPTPIDSAWAPVVAARSQVMREVAMPEDYFLYGEELEWFHRLRSAGARVELLPTVRVLHFGGVRVVRPDKSRLQARNSVRAVRRIRGRRAALLVWPRVVAWQLRLLAASVARREGSNAIRSHTVGVGSALMAWREITVPASP